MISDPSGVFLEDFHEFPEQSAIYKDIRFSCHNKSCLAICVTPQCEMGKSRELYHTFCRLIPFELLLASCAGKHFTLQELAGERELTEKLTDRAKKFAKQFREQFIGNMTHRYYFIPGSEEVEVSFVDFQVIECIKDEDLDSSHKIAVLRSPWREQLPTKYSFYQARIGVPPYDKELISKILRSADVPLLRDVLS